MCKKGKKTMFLIGTGYLIGLAIASVFTNKKGEEVKQDMEGASKEGKSKLSAVWNNIIEIHKSFFYKVKSDITSEESKQYFNDKKDELFRVVDDYKVDGEKLLFELKDKGVEYVEEFKEKFEKIKEKAPEKLEEVKKSFLDKVK